MKRISIFVKILTIILLLPLCLSSTPQDEPDKLYQTFRNPPAEARAFVRWWWNGNRVNDKEVIRELNLLKDAGFGGVEINPIKMPPVENEPEQKQLEWLSPDWIQVLKTACLGAHERGMIADLLVGSGWPFGGKFLSHDQTIERMAVNYRDFEGPTEIKIRIKELEDDLPANYLRDKREKESERQIKFIRLFPDDISSTDQITDFTPDIKGGEVSISIPAGKYRLAWGVLQKGYREVVHGTLGAEGPTMDHFDIEVVQAFLDRLLEIEEELGIPLDQLIRALFADSMELAGSNWCNDFSEEFLKRNGYSIDPYLPFILYYSKISYSYEIQDDEFRDEILRARFDYTKTLVDLFHERFTTTFQNFCTEHGLKCRYQAYGSPWLMGILDGYMKVDIPESNNWLYSQGTLPDAEDYFTWSKEHGYMIWNKYASSGGHLSGKDIISCEAMTNLGGVFQASLSTIKQAGDMNFITGITHSVLHGYNYSPPEAGLPGWIRYGTFFSEHNTLWPHFKKWLDYEARVSAVLQNSNPIADIAILPPEADDWSKYGLIRQPFHTEPWYVFELWQGISQNGSSCDYVSENILQEARIKNGGLSYGPMNYRTLILADVQSLEPNTAKAILKFVAKGGKLISIGNVASRSSSMNEASNDSDISGTIEKLKKYKDRVHFVEAPAEGTDLTGWTGSLFEKINYYPDVKIENPDRSLYQIHHKSGDRDIFFFANTNRKQDHSSKISFDLSGKSVWKWDPEKGNKELLSYHSGGINISLKPLQSMLFVIEPFEYNGKEKKSYNHEGEHKPLELDSGWTAEFYPVEGESFTRSLSELIDFRESDDPILQNFAGDVIYKAKFDASESRFSSLNLGEVNDGVTKVILNGMSLGKQWYGKHEYEIGSQLRLGPNEIEIVYTSLLSNYCRSLDKIEAKRWIGKRELLSNGLVGPVVFR